MKLSNLLFLWLGGIMIGISIGMTVTKHLTSKEYQNQYMTKNNGYIYKCIAIEKVGK